MTCVWTLLLTVTVVLAFPSDPRADPVRAGWSEPVNFLRLAVRLMAKLDTGAKTSALGGHNLRYFKRNGSDWVAFTLLSAASEHVHVERPVARFAKIRRAGAPVQTRPVVALLICVAGIKRRAEFTVNDRRGMAYPVLLGRRFLAGRIVVDAAEQNLSDGSCGR